MKKYILPTVAILGLLFISSCAPEAGTEKEYGFWYGLLHGFILPFAIIGKIFKMDIGIYALTNTGTFYWIGYFFGFAIISGGGRRCMKKKKKKDC